MAVHWMLGLLVLAMNFADNATTFLCLRAPVPGFEVVEANPVARLLFERLGLLPGLALEMALTLGAVCFLVTSRRLPPPLRLALLGALAVLPAWASAHNLNVMHALGIGPS